MEKVITRNTIITADNIPASVCIAVDHLKRDIEKSCCTSKQKGVKICLVFKKQAPEEFCIELKESLQISAGDDLGFIYGIYEISRSILGIQPFWFWYDQKIIPRESYQIPKGYYFASKKPLVRYRGWFVNDEVLIHTWSIDSNREKPWEMIFEALLRCGGNMVIPGTDSNSKRYRKLAAEMGLYITHHHAEPLGAEMFARAYPNLNPSYPEHPDQFEQLWRDGIQDQNNMKIIWNIGFRGQGDRPFWEDDPQYDTPELRGRLISQLIRNQYELVKSIVPDGVCCTNLYGEIMELYQDGVLSLPEDVIRIWADNGYGKMVSRRQNNHNPRIVSLPKSEDQGKHGIYYHVSFYDLQAANHITMLPNSPEFIVAELKEIVTRGVQDYWIINCSNVKPHVYYLDLISKFWNGEIHDPETHRKQFVLEYYGKVHAAAIEKCLKAYHEYALQYGIHDDEHAGEQFSNHIMRILVSQYMRDSGVKADDLQWAVSAASLIEQIQWYGKLCEKAWKGYHDYYQMCNRTAADLHEEMQLFNDTILLQALIHYRCYKGASYACQSLLYAFTSDYKRAFYLAGKGRDEYIYANRFMRESEHGKWRDFYENECLTDIKQSSWVLESLMGYLRNLGEGPHFYEWQREFLYPEEDRKVMLILNMNNHLNNDTLYQYMQKSWEE